MWHLLGCLMCCPLENDVLFTPIVTREEEDRQIWFRKQQNTSFFEYWYTMTVMKMFGCLGYCMFPQIRRRGNVVIAYTFDEKAEYNQLYDSFGDTIDGVLTDKPTLLGEWFTSFIANNLSSVIKLGKVDPKDSEDKEMHVFLV